MFQTEAMANVKALRDRKGFGVRNRQKQAGLTPRGQSTMVNHQSGLNREWPDLVSTLSVLLLSSLQSLSHVRLSVTHGLQHTRTPCLSPTPRVCSNSCPLNQWFHPTISSSVIPFSSCPQSFPASGSFQMSQLFSSGGRSTGVSASASVLPMNIQDWFPLGWTVGSPYSSRDSQESNTTVQKHQFFSTQLSLQSNSHIHTWLLEKP